MQTLSPRRRVGRSLRCRTPAGWPNADAPNADPPAGFPNADGWPNEDWPNAEVVDAPAPNAEGVDVEAAPAPKADGADPLNAPNPLGLPKAEVDAGAPKAEVDAGAPNAEVVPPPKADAAPGGAVPKGVGVPPEE
ncbi:hypothetical protein NUW54_g7433 [Trametes sanguinea]|uniref:Uncharacterized protein n=1 Tax=Trametes sanguinea TaxID=158606 RepID=A0ACC1PMF1_9APHY|nr:hypothetical protein NUW54_g7433 [Trametes sanguinea]